MKLTAIAGLVLLLTACAAHGPRCNSGLRPIEKSAPQSIPNAANALRR